MRASVLVLIAATGLVLGSAPGVPARGSADPRSPVRTAKQDQITSLPGLDAKAADFRQYSGYLSSQISGDFYTPEYTHYWLVEAQNNRTGQVPLLVWLNGGPGTSSLRGLFHENGPFEVAKDGKTLTMREFSWNKLANVLYLESPVSVGYSNTRGAGGMDTDRNTARQVWLGLKSFFKKFPHYKNTPLYLAGEGYGAANALSVAYYQGDFPNLAGFISGNGYLHGRYMDKAGVLSAHDHGWVSPTDGTWARLSDYCCDGKTPTWWGCDMRGVRCARLVGQIFANVETQFGVNPYNIKEDCSRPGADCEDSGPLTAYLNQQVVRDALHIPAGGRRWKMHRELSYYISDIVSEGAGLVPQVKGLRVPLLVYNGDADIVCSVRATGWFVDELGRRETAQRVPLKVANETVGTVQEYEGGLSLVTVNNAGHSVPREKPRVAFELVKRFLEKTRAR